MGRTPYQQWVPKADEQADDGDYNTACVMLYRWWGLFEAPPGTDTSKFPTGLFDDRVHVQMPDFGIDITGADALRKLIAALPAGSTRSHSVRDDAIEVSYLGNGLYRLQAPYTYQVESPDGRFVSGNAHCDCVLKKHGPTRMTFTKIGGKRGAPLERAQFDSSYRLHRVKAVLLQWQANMDTLSGNSSGLKELVMEDLQFHGLISAKQDHSKAQQTVVKDFTEMKGMLAGTDGTEDTVIRGFDGVTAWFATGPVAAQAQYPSRRRIPHHAAQCRSLRRRRAVRLVRANAERRRDRAASAARMGDRGARREVHAARTIASALSVR